MFGINTSVLNQLSKSHRYYMGIVVFAAAYFILGKLGLALSTVSQNVTLIWPPTGFALVVLLVAGKRFWPAILIGTFCVNITTDIPFGAAAAIAVGNTLEAVLGCYLLTRFKFNPALRSVRDVFLLIILGAGVSTTVSAFIGSLSLYHWDVIDQSQVGVAWLTWWMGDAMGDLFFAPMMLSLLYKGEDEIVTLRKRVEAILLISLTLICTELVFGGHIQFSGQRDVPLAFLTLPFLPWAAFRFGIRGAIMISALISAVALYHVINNEGLFQADTISQRLFLVWSYVNIVSVTGMVLAASIHERKLAEAKIFHLAHHDLLTKLPNRAALQREVSMLLSRSKTSKAKLAVFFIDLDRFKTINDTLGHEIGDMLLGSVAERLRLNIKENDILSRHGGDEFVLVCLDVDSNEQLEKIAQRVLNVVSRPYQVDQYELHITPSIGISLYPQDGDNFNVLLKNADTAMYEAKKLTACFQYYSKDMNEHAIERLTIESMMHSALKNDEFELHYQPQFNLKTGKLDGVEALIRWDNPTLGLLPPVKFIPIAEESGLILSIGEWVIEEACRQKKIWDELGYKDIRISVNISARQLWQLNLPEMLNDILVHSDVDTAFIELEVTESMLIGFSDEMLRLLNELKNYGFTMSIDDFGTGYSSLSYLKKLPTSKIKIDQSFVRDITSDSDDAAITAAIIAMAHNMGLSVVAEGVETEAQLEFLRGQGCDIAQGYYFAKPLPASECVAVFDHWQGNSLNSKPASQS